MDRRSFNLLAVSAFATTISGLITTETFAAETEQPKVVAVLTVKLLCCAKESVPAIKELSKIPGVGRISVNHKARTLTIAATADGTSPSPKAIWEAAEKVKIGPIKLAVVGGEFTSKPEN